MRLWLPAALLALWGLLAFGAGFLPLKPNLIHLEHILGPPAPGAWLGYDDLGRDIGERLLVGARTSFLVAVWVVSLSALLGTVVGTVGAYWGGWWDREVQAAGCLPAPSLEAVGQMMRIDNSEGCNGKPKRY